MSQRTIDPGLSQTDIDTLQMVDAYWMVWVNWSRDAELIELAMPVRRGSGSISKRINRLKKLGYIGEFGYPIFGGGVAFPLTTIGVNTLKAVSKTKRE